MGCLLRSAMPLWTPPFLIECWKYKRPYSALHNQIITSGAPWNGICQTVFVENQGKRIQLNLYNTAMLSRRNEKQGELRVPISIVRSKAGLAKDTALSVSVFHHSYLWLESNQAIEFRSHIEATSDVALMGHQHYPHAFYKQNSTGERILYVEGDALQDEGYPQKSAFRVLLF